MATKWTVVKCTTCNCATKYESRTRTVSDAPLEERVEYVEDVTIDDS